MEHINIMLILLVVVIVGYVAGKLEYMGGDFDRRLYHADKNDGLYDIMVETDGGSFTVEPQTVTFDATTNLKNDLIFYVSTYYVYSGNVYYEGSSIPVVGASFKICSFWVVMARRSKGWPA